MPCGVAVEPLINTVVEECDEPRKCQRWWPVWHLQEGVTTLVGSIVTELSLETRDGSRGQTKYLLGSTEPSIYISSYHKAR